MTKTIQRLKQTDRMPANQRLRLPEVPGYHAATEPLTMTDDCESGRLTVENRELHVAVNELRRELADALRFQADVVAERNYAVRLLTEERDSLRHECADLTAERDALKAALLRCGQANK